jgi:hypothetical protein
MKLFYRYCRTDQKINYTDIVGSLNSHCGRNVPYGTREQQQKTLWSADVLSLLPDSHHVNFSSPPCTPHDD